MVLEHKMEQIALQSGAEDLIQFLDEQEQVLLKALANQDYGAMDQALLAMQSAIIRLRHPVGARLAREQVRDRKPLDWVSATEGKPLVEKRTPFGIGGLETNPGQDLLLVKTSELPVKLIFPDRNPPDKILWKD